MKKLVIITCLLFGVFSAGISQLSFAAGSQLILNGSIFGVQGKAIYDINELWAGAGSFTLHLENSIDYTIDLDAHYKAIEIGDGFDLSPVGGLSISSRKVNGDGDSDIGINLGAFISFTASESINVYIEPKLKIADIAEGLTISGGILF
ncbi:MAG: hypothetical protein HKO89_03710 [Saprospiraceae bacterium]|nr:hypothetical protein [Bacteroidia bacterium]NNK89690.1 hypothetical protein [Saprospiraceae bacterium]